MKIQTENTDFECPCCADPYSQCPYITSKKKKFNHNKNKFMSFIYEEREAIISWAFAILSVFFICFACYISAISAQPLP